MKTETTAEKPIAEFLPDSCPLVGSNLLEASAGTGKTYSLAWLYLRLLLEKNWRVEQILVSTFTRATVAELKVRIYQMLEQASVELQKQLQPTHSAECVANDLSIYLQNQSRIRSPEELLLILHLGKSEFDRAQIFSIDGLCLSLLQKQALMLGSYIPETIIDDATEKAMIKTWLATQLTPEITALCRPETWQWLLTHDPETSLYDLRNQADAFAQTLPDIEKMAKQQQQQYQQVEDLAEKLQQLLAQEPDTFADLFVALDSKHLSGTYYKRDSLLQLIESVIDPQYWQARVWLKDTQKNKDTGVLEHKSLKKLSSEFICHKGLNKSGQNATWMTAFSKPIYQLFDRLIEPINWLIQHRFDPQIRADLNQLLVPLADYLDGEKARLLQLSYDDISQRTSRAAQAGILDTDYQAALIDEVQDANFCQLQLFDALFIQTRKIIFLVGDPKQAIYRFRGGDIYAYLQLQQQVDTIYRLGCNYRSLASFNDSINYLFSGKLTQDPVDSEPNGASDSSSQGVFLERHIHYTAVQSYALTHESYPALHYVAYDLGKGAKSSQEESPSQTTATENAETQTFAMETAPSDKVLAAQACARVIEALLHGAGELPTEKYHLQTDQSVSQAQRLPALQPADIAVLVPKNSDLIVLKNALEARGIACTNTGRSNVFLSEAAYYLHTLLSVLNNFRDSDLRLLLTQPLLALSVKDLMVLRDWQSAQALALLAHYRLRLLTYGQRFQQEDFSITFYQLLEKEQLLGNLLGHSNGERLVTDFMHLLECLQTEHGQSKQTLESALSQLEKGMLSGKEEALKISNLNAVTLQTIHKSKGLDYSVVIMPYLPKSSRLAKQDDRNGKSNALRAAWLQFERVALPDHCRQEEHESAAEQQRQYYVALTRGKLKNIVLLPAQFDNAKMPRISDKHREWLCEERVMRSLQTQAFFKLQSLEAFCAGAVNAMGSGEKKLTTQFNQPDQKKAINQTSKKLKQYYAARWRLESFSGWSVYYASQNSHRKSDPESHNGHLNSFRGLSNHLASSTTNLSGTDLTDTDLTNPEWSKQSDWNNWGLRTLKQDEQRWHVHDVVAIAPSASEHHHATDAIQTISEKIASIWQAYPRGAEAGSALHQIFELAMQQRQLLSDQKRFSHAIQTQLQTYVVSLANTVNQLPENWSDELAKAVTAILRKPIINNLSSLPTNFSAEYQQTFSLSEILLSQQSIEMGFFLHLSAQKRRRLLDSLGFLDKTARHQWLSDFDPESYLRGFIDLMFYHQGRYYLLDYKSNYLGENVGDYQQPAMRQAMLEHGYYQQAQIYTLALIKHLRQFDSAFDVDRQFGGAIYLFVRGVAGEGSNAEFATNHPQMGVFHFMPDVSTLLAILDDD